MKRLLIVFEGVDRCGKSTQAKCLAEAMSKMISQPVHLMNFPDRSTPIGKGLNEYLKGNLTLNEHAAHLLFTANRWEKADEINQKLLQGIPVIIDRYSYSGIAYTVAKDIKLKNFDWAMKSEEGLPIPDIIFCFTLNDVNELQNREGYGEEVFENVPFQIRVSDAYKEISKYYQKQWKWINCSNKSIDEIHKEVYSTVEKYLENIN